MPAIAAPRRVRRGILAAAALLVALLPLAPALLAAGPPYPDPVSGQRVYDTAGAFDATVIAQTEAQIKAIEARVGAQIVVYTQLVDTPRDTATAEADARALMDQWGVGRKGFDDGLVILFDLNQGDACHGQVQLYAGPGFAATYLTNEERQAIYESDMLPLLRDCQLGPALQIAMTDIDSAATPEHAAALNGARQLNAVLGLVVAPVILVLIVGYGLLRWRRTGKDPVYTDDPSILMPAPPPGLTPAAGAAIRDGGASRRAMTAASLDLAVRGLAAFKAETVAISGKPGLGIYTGQVVTSDPAEQARIDRARRRPMDPATTYLLSVMTSAAGATSYLPADQITKIGEKVPTFNSQLEQHLVDQGWYRTKPSSITSRWGAAGVLLIVLGVIVAILGVNMPSSGILVVGIALAVAGVATVIIGSQMPARTQAGAVIVAMLEAYRRTLTKTMSQARSMGDVVTQAAVPLIESPDDAVAWGVALGLQNEVEDVLKRATEDQAPGGPRPYIPLWYAGPASGAWGGSGGAGGFAPGLMSSSPMPDFGGMFAALGTIGTPPSSSGSGGGGFGGGGSGGGGGGAGGGF